MYVDGFFFFFFGAVGDFDEETEELTLPPGPPLRASGTGFQWLTFDVMIQTGKTISFRTPMVPVQ